MTAPRSALQDFALANPLYVGASITAYKANALGVATTTLADLYADPLSNTKLPNPQVLDSKGKWKAPVYFDGPVILVVSNVAAIPDHNTGLIVNRGSFKGAYATGTQYVPDDIVQNPVDKKVYAANDVFVSDAGGIAVDIAANHLRLILIPVENVNAFGPADAQASAFAWDQVSDGAANTYHVELTPVVTAYTPGLRVSFRAHQDCAATPTMSLNGLGAKQIVTREGYGLQAGDIGSNHLVNVIYDGVSFRMLENTRHIGNDLGVGGVVTSAGSVVNGPQSVGNDQTVGGAQTVTGQSNAARFVPTAGYGSGPSVYYPGSNTIGLKGGNATLQLDSTRSDYTFPDGGPGSLVLSKPGVSNHDVGFFMYRNGVYGGSLIWNGSYLTLLTPTPSNGLILSTANGQFVIDNSGRINVASASTGAGYTASGDINLPNGSKIRSLNTAKAWVTFAGNSGGIYQQWNVSSVTRNGTGDYTVNFANALNDASYCWNASCARSNTAANAHVGRLGSELKTSTQCRIHSIVTGSATPDDSTEVCFTAYGY